MRHYCGKASVLSRAVAYAFGLAAAATVPWPATAAGLIAADGRSSTSMAHGIAPSSLLTIDQNRATVVDGIVANWGDSLAGSTAGLSNDRLRTLLSRLRADHLLAASLAGSLEGLRNVIDNSLTVNAPVARHLLNTKALGSATSDLVYTPVTPCRILDTRFATGGVLQAGQTRNWLAANPSGNFSTQGGAGSNCGLPIKPAAVLINLTVANTTGAQNFLAVWPFNVAQPNASTVNWTAPGQQIANAVIVPLCVGVGCTSDFNSFASGQTDLIGDALGYFAAPGALPPYVDNGDGTVTDNKTGLMWEMKLATISGACTDGAQANRDARCQQNTYTWSAASPFAEPTGTLYSDFLERLNDLKKPNDGTATPCFANHCDWRIPTIGELRSILSTPYPDCSSIPCIDAIFGPTQASFYWSSSSLASSPSVAWAVSFNDGFVNFGSKSSDTHARAVRSGR